jgi:hypothetical protein
MRNVLFGQILNVFELPRQIFVETPKIKFHEKPSIRNKLFHAEGQEDVAKLAFAFRDCFAKAPKIKIKGFDSYNNLKRS